VKFGERGKSSEGRSSTLGFQWGLTVSLTKGGPPGYVDLVKGSIGFIGEVFEVMTQVDLGLTSVGRFDSANSTISANDAN
jgi:hypothetical protein